MFLHQASMVIFFALIDLEITIKIQSGTILKQQDGDLLMIGSKS